MRIFTVFFALLYCSGAWGQHIKPSLNASSISENSSDAGSVDYATGIMTYHLPLISKKDGGLEVRVGISYAGKGIKVDQNPSSVGLGWHLTGTGAVTRSIRGLPDDSTEPGKPGILYVPVPTDPAQMPEFRKQVNKNQRDGESDIFDLSYPQAGLQVKFYLTRIPVPYGTPYKFAVVLLEKTDVKITVIQDEATNEISGFEVINVGGDRYRFMEKEELGAHYYSGVDAGSSIQQTPNAWYLTEMKSYTGEVVRFEYFADISSENRSLKRQNAIVYGQAWKDVGKNEGIRNQIQNRMNELMLDAEERDRIVDRMRALEININYAIWNFKNISAAPAMNSIEMESRSEAELADVYMSSAQRTTLWTIKTYSDELNQLARSLPERNFAPEDDSYLQSLMQQLYTTPTYTSASTTFSPEVYFTRVKLLKRIVLDGSNIEFKYTTSTRELKPTTFLDEIKVLSSNQELLKKVKFEYTPHVVYTADPYLKAVQVKGTDAGDNEGRYTFDYYNEGQYFDVYDKDFWGFNNGPRTEDVSLLPLELTQGSSSAIADFFGTSGHSFSIPHASELSFNSRIPVSEKTIFRSLKSVGLPNGGKQTFEYENNTVNSNYTPTLKVGGLRIKKITTDDGLGNQYAKHYKYEFPDANNQLVSTGFNVKKGHQTMTLRVDYETIPDDIVVGSEPYDFSGQLEEAGNENTFYSYVEERVEGLGRTGYKYLHFYADANATYPYWLERTLLAKAIYNEQGNLKYLERYKYQADPNDITPFSSEYSNKFELNNQFGFASGSTQYRAFPYQTPEYSPDMYPEIQFGYSKINFSSLYTYNVVKRLAISNLPQEYIFRIGGKMLLKEKESWTAVQNGNSGISPGAGDDRTNSWLFGNNYGPGNWNREIRYYDNIAHTYPTRIENLGSAGEKTLVKMKYAADYAAGAASFIPQLQSSNCLNEVVEQQKWKYIPSASAWRLTGGQLTTYGTVNTAPEAVSSAVCILPLNTYVTELDQALLPGTGGWNENVTSQPPYQQLFHESQNLYKPFSQTSWTAYPWGIQQSGTATHNNLIKQAARKDMLENVIVKGALGTEVLKILNLGNREIKRPVSTYSNFMASGYDNIGYIKDLRSRLKKVIERHYLYDDPVYVLADSIALSLENLLDFNTFKSLWIRFDANLSSAPPSQQADYDSLFAPYTSFNELSDFSAKLYPASFNEYIYNSLFSNRNYLVTSTGGVELRMALTPYLASGKRLQFTSNYNFSIGFSIVYSDGTPAIQRTVSGTETRNGFKMGFLDLTGLPNYTNVSELVFYSSGGDGGLFVVPEGSEFNFSSFNTRGLLTMEVNEKGEKLNYQYDGRDRLEYVKDKDNNVLKHYKYHQVTP